MNDVGTPNEGGKRAGQLITAPQTTPAIRDPYGPLGGYGLGVDTPQDQLIPKLLEYWRILNKHKWLILCVTLAFGALTTVRTLMQTPLYSATVRLQIDRNVAQVVQGGNIDPTENDYYADDFMQTQYELLQGRTMAERVASSLTL